MTVLSPGSAVISGGGLISGAVLNDTVLSNGSNPHTALYINKCAGFVNDVDVIRGNIYAQGTGTMTNLRQSGAQVIMRGADTFVSGAVVTGKRDGRTTDHELGRLYFQDDAVGSDITVGSGGSLVIFRAKTVVSNLLVSGNSANTSISMSSGGQVISGLTVRGHGAKIFLGGVKVYDVDIRTTNRVTLQDSWAAAEIVGGYVESTTLGMGNGTIKNVTIGPSTYVNLTGSKGTDLNLGAKFISGSAVSGAQIRKAIATSLSPVTSA